MGYMSELDIENQNQVEYEQNCKDSITELKKSVTFYFELLLTEKYEYKMNKNTQRFFKSVQCKTTAIKCICDKNIHTCFNFSLNAYMNT